MKRLLAVVAIVAVSTAALGDNRRGGDFWQGMQASQKSTYVVGLLDGILVGQNFAWMGLAKKKASDPCIVKEETAFHDMVNSYIGSSTAGQIVDGLDNFYSDYRNRSILIPDAVWVVLNEIHGMPDDQVKKMIESLRKLSS